MSRPNPHHAYFLAQLEARQRAERHAQELDSADPTDVPAILERRAQEEELARQEHAARVRARHRSVKAGLRDSALAHARRMGVA